MYYAPHTLYVRRQLPPKRDEFGRIIPNSVEEGWIEVCKCRCDDNNISDFRTETGSYYRPKYHIVCEKATDVKAGELIRCLHNKAIRGEGHVFNVKNLNMLSYSEIWV